MNIIVIGGGLAGASAVEELRAQGYDGDLTLVGAEPHLPYERPPLSKGLLLGTADPASVFLHDEAWYADQQVEVLLEDPVTSIDPDRSRVLLRGRDLTYDRLLIATGAHPRTLTITDQAAQAGVPVAYLRTLDDAVALKDQLAGRIVVVGAGWIGLEVAAAARQAGAEVTVIERAAQPLEAVLGPELGAVFADLHREHGVDLRLGTDVEESALAGADLVIVAVGVTPAAELAVAAGLACENGILVNTRLRASDPHVFAAGDVANHDHPVLGRVRVEHWDSAIRQGRAAARVMLGGDEAYDRMPYFFTDQYDVGMEYVGHVGAIGYDEVVVDGDTAARTLVAWWLRAGTVVAGMHLNRWDTIDTIRASIGRPLPRAARGSPATKPSDR
jgi:3-phenylpropionate/trans-cinnamate dioxygenase ferredoxin reductase component